MKNESADYWIDKLELLSHPEGGFYKEIYRSDEAISSDALPERYKGERSFSTSIYFLLRENEFSAFHRLQSDEIWHFYSGGPCEFHIITTEGIIIHKVIGRDIEAHQSFQILVPKRSWFAANPVSGSKYSLVGCTMSPGFSFNDFELAKFEALSNQFPMHSEIIRKYSKE